MTIVGVCDRPTYEPRPASEAESTMLWLCEIDTRLQNEKAKLIAGYPRHDTPDHVAEAIDLIERAQDQLAKERRELDAMERDR